MAEDIRLQVRDAIHYARRELRWRPGKAKSHLLKRISLRHLKLGTTLDEYESIIRQVLHEPEAKVYLFSYQGKDYPSLFSERAEKSWLVMLDIEGRMETAFVVENPETYFANSHFTFLGTCQGVLS